ncbi:MAG: hypothetical protein NT154_02130 [Verrucomicrobia bacterium]|nr:hypothetical protein [Verrucomicrobiota bacterium]
MRTSYLLAACLNLFFSTLQTRGQGTFQNLGFESASIVPISDIFIQFSTAFPHWTCTVAGVQQTFALYNTLALSTSGVAAINHDWPYPTAGVIAGNYTAVLQGGMLGPENPASTTLSQTGLVPATAQSLLFKAYCLGSSAPVIPLVVTLGGQQLSLISMGSGVNYTLMGADIHGLAGQSVELDFTVRGSVNINSVFLDSIQFSTQLIPEPSVFGLATLGALFLGWRVLRRRR